jgi:5-methylcytosine-specific restriction protein B
MEQYVAIVRSLEWITRGGSVHPTQVDCEVRAIADQGVTYLQISSFGSDSRQREKKVSQTLQFDRETALALAAHIERVFGRPSS